MAKQSQRDKFKAAAREVQADDNERRFNERLSKIARRKPKESTRKKRKA